MLQQASFHKLCSRWMSRTRCVATTASELADELIHEHACQVALGDEGRRTRSRRPRIGAPFAQRKRMVTTRERRFDMVTLAHLHAALDSVIEIEGLIAE